MYPNEPTITEDLNRMISEQSTVTNEYIIKKLIEQHDTTEMEEGVRYYFNQNDIMQKKRYMWKDQAQFEDLTKPNNRLPSGWHKLLVDQKVSFLTGNPVVVSAEDEKLNEELQVYFNDDFDDDLSELVKNASNKGVEWLHPYIDEDGNFDYAVIPAEQVIPIWEGRHNKRLQALIRYFEVNKDLDEQNKITRIQYWTPNQVYYYVKDGNGEIVADTFEGESVEDHFTYGDVGYGWGKVPFIPFRNNEEEKSDLTFVKEYIDAYDSLRSDAQDNFQELQAMIYVLKNYEGQSLSEFQDNLRYYKAMNVSGDGGVDTLVNEIPIDSVERLLDLTQQDIIAFGMGVNPKQDAFGANPTGVALQFLYSLLDMKARQLERKFVKSLKELCWFLTEYLSMSGKGDYDPETVKFTFNHAMIFNESEQIQNAMLSGARVSEETATAKHPYVDDVYTEMERKEAESLRSIDLDEGEDDESKEEV